LHSDPDLFVAARGPHTNRVVDLATINYHELGHFGADGRTAAGLKEEIEQAVKEMRAIYEPLEPDFFEDDEPQAGPA